MFKHVKYQPWSAQRKVFQTENSKIIPHKDPFKGNCNYNQWRNLIKPPTTDMENMLTWNMIKTTYDGWANFRIVQSLCN